MLRIVSSYSMLSKVPVGERGALLRHLRLRLPGEEQTRSSKEPSRKLGLKRLVITVSVRLDFLGRWRSVHFSGA